jgi:hypothetical protein
MEELGVIGVIVVRDAHNLVLEKNGMKLLLKFI